MRARAEPLDCEKIVEMGPLAHGNDLHCSFVVKYTDVLPFQNKWLINFWLKKLAFMGAM